MREKSKLSCSCIYFILSTYRIENTVITQKHSSLELIYVKLVVQALLGYRSFNKFIREKF